MRNEEAQVWTRSPRLVLGLSAALAALVLLPACATTSHSPDTSSGAPQATTPITTVPITTVPPSPPVAATQQTQKWTDLQVGDCLAELPPVDLSAQTVTVVDCATPHAAEVYLRAPVEVNAAIADVANKKCTAGFKEYTGQPIGGPGPMAYAMTYLIDSDQNRTSSNPDPSTVICLLEAAGSGPLTSSARR
jgi:hypothetical protein